MDLEPLQDEALYELSGWDETRRMKDTYHLNAMDMPK